MADSVPPAAPVGEAPAEADAAVPAALVEDAPELRGDGVPVAAYVAGVRPVLPVAGTPRVGDAAGVGGRAEGGSIQADCGRGAGRADGM